MVEYKVLDVRNDDLEEELNEYAEQGWTLKSVIPQRDCDYVWVVMERERNPSVREK